MTFLLAGVVETYTWASMENVKAIKAKMARVSFFIVSLFVDYYCFPPQKYRLIKKCATL
jgi:hypothetical protein